MKTKGATIKLELMDPAYSHKYLINSVDNRILHGLLPVTNRIWVVVLLISFKITKTLKNHTLTVIPFRTPRAMTALMKSLI